MSILKYLKEALEDISYIFGEDIDSDDAQRVYEMAKQHGVNILSDKEIYCIAKLDDIVVGGLWTAWVDNEFSFDIVVQDKYQGKGIGSRLVDIAISEYHSGQDAYDNEVGTIIRAEVINQDNMKPLLLKKGFRIEKELSDRTIMVKESYSGTK